MRRVGLLLPNRFPGLPSYRLPDDAGEPAVGARVAAPFGSALVTGLVADRDPPPAPEGTAERDVVAVLEEEPFLPPALVAVLVRAAAYYVVAPGEMLRAAVPARLLVGGDAVYAPTNAAVGASLSGVAGAVLALLVERGEARLPELVEALGRRGLASALKELVSGGFARIRSEPRIVAGADRLHPPLDDGGLAACTAEQRRTEIEDKRFVPPKADAPIRRSSTGSFRCSLT